MPTSRAEYEANPSTKLNILIKVIKHHMTTPNAPVLRIEEIGAGNTLVIDETVVLAPTDGSPDKILVYCHFPSQNTFLVEVSQSSVVSAVTAAERSTVVQME